MTTKALVALAGALLLAGCQTNTIADAQFSKAVPANGQIVLNQWASLNPDCSAYGPVAATVLEQPQHGRISVVRKKVYTGYSVYNPRSRCNSKGAPGGQAIYKPDPNYVGLDRASMRIIFPDGGQRIRRYLLDVK